MLKYQSREDHGEEEGGLNSFSAIMLLTFVFWTIFGAAFATIIFLTIRKSSSKAFFGSASSSDYQRHDDGGII